MVNLIENPTDVVSSRIAMARGALCAIANTYDDAEQDYTMSGPYMYLAIWALQELLDQAHAAMDALVAEGAR